MTYPDPTVTDELGRNFVVVPVNTVEPGPRERELAREFRQAWTPTFVFLDPHRIEVRRTVGYLPPEEFVPELKLARASAALLRGDAGSAHEVFLSVAQDHPRSAAAPEALYWAGVAGYRREGKRDELLRQWNALRERYPQSAWWTRASFIAG